ncbi:Crp/Fnr family transcriptional regulator [Devosia sp. A16]|uniref:Crp/Fnr family transcriptional regulator n=1 Tax=Devosia sp. A16 TaxID=1736675 RepID=UPI0006D76C19|nr:Crp/Fnr family transcriptional regulator [Devosia sp. A16]
MSDASFQNLLLGRLPADDRSLLDLELVDVALRHHLHAAGAPVDALYFPEDGMASVVAQVGRSAIEVGLIGREGVTSPFVVTGDTLSPFDTFSQAAGTAYRAPIDRVRQALRQSQAFAGLLSRYYRAFEIQVTATSVTNGQARLGERLARWLLMVSDRLGPHFHITHDLLATMLAVRRSSVTLALQLLEGEGLIRSTRGHLVILDRKRLVERADHSYGLAEAEYRRLMQTG